jgi:hypothetical protein
VIGTNDLVAVEDWFVSEAERVEHFELSNGLTLFSSDVQVLVDAMAPLFPPPFGQTALTTEYLNLLQSDISAVWN